MNNTGRVLVVGGAGYIGGSVTDLLVSRGIPFTVYDDLVYEPHYLKNVDFIRGNVLDTARLKAALDLCPYVIWLAAIVGDGACALQPEDTIAVNQNSVAWLAKNYDGRIVFTSTCSVYGEMQGKNDEEGPTNPLSLYAQTKLNAEGFLKGKDALIFRLGTAFGISDTYARPRMDLVANQMPVAALTKGTVTVFGGTQWRPMVHVEDIASACVNNLFRPVRGIYNLAAVNMTIKDVAETVQRATGCGIEYKPLGSDARDYFVSTDKALRDGIYNPATQHTIEHGVRQFANLVKAGRITDTENSVYSNVRYLGRRNKQ